MLHNHLQSSSSIVHRRRLLGAQSASEKAAASLKPRLSTNRLPTLQLFSTRIIKKDLNPVWEQTAFLLVSDDEVRANENLSVQLWDSDGE